jgi:hypothetical protein
VYGAVSTGGAAAVAITALQTDSKGFETLI